MQVITLKKRSVIGGYWYMARNHRMTKLGLWRTLKLHHDVRRMSKRLSK